MSDLSGGRPFPYTVCSADKWAHTVYCLLTTTVQYMQNMKYNHIAVDFNLINVAISVRFDIFQFIDS